MSNQIVLSQAKADQMLKQNRRRVFTTEFEVATAKLVYETRSEEYEAARQARLAFEAAHPWLLSELEPIPKDLKVADEGMIPEYLTIQQRWRALCDRCDRISDQLFSAPAALQNAITKQADFEIKSGQMVNAASALAAMLSISGAAAKYIDSQRSRDAYLSEITRIRQEFIAANPHLTVRTTSEV